MSGKSRSARVILAGVIFVSWSAAAAWSATSQSSARVGGGFGPAAKSSKHPKKTTSFLGIPGDLDGVEGGHRLCASYQRPPGSKDKGNLSAKVAVERDGGTTTVVNIPKGGVSSGQARTCSADSVELQEGDLLVWTFTFKGMPKIPSGEEARFAGEVLAPGNAFGSLQLSTDEPGESRYWIDGGNLVFCTTNAGFADLWIRLAADGTNNGESAPHIDIDVCNFSGGGSHSPLDPQNPSCGSAKTFDIFWHDEEGNFFSNQANARDCQLEIVETGSGLEGVFGCEQLRGSEGTVDVLGGAFRCQVE